jgi:hypothetical protein
LGVEDGLMAVKGRLRLWLHFYEWPEIKVFELGQSFERDQDLTAPAGPPPVAVRRASRKISSENEKNFCALILS